MNCETCEVSHICPTCGKMLEEHHFHSVKTSSHGFIMLLIPDGDPTFHCMTAVHP